MPPRFVVTPCSAFCNLVVRSAWSVAPSALLGPTALSAPRTYPMAASASPSLTSVSVGRRLLRSATHRTSRTRFEEETNYVGWHVIGTP